MADLGSEERQLLRRRLRRVLLLLLLGLQGGVVYVPHEQAFRDDGDQHDDEDGEQHGRGVERVDRLVGGADLGEPAELAAARGDDADVGHGDRWLKVGLEGTETLEEARDAMPLGEGDCCLTRHNMTRGWMDGLDFRSTLACCRSVS